MSKRRIKAYKWQQKYKRGQLGKVPRRRDSYGSKKKAPPPPQAKDPRPKWVRQREATNRLIDELNHTGAQCHAECGCYYARKRAEQAKNNEKPKTGTKP